MNRFTAKFVQGAARLAFWRKRAAPPDAPVAEAAADAGPTAADPDAAVDAPAPQPGRFARLKQALHWRRSPVPESDPDQTPLAAPLEQAEASAAADEMPAPQLSWLARLANRLRRPSPPTAEGADAPTTEPNQAAQASDEAEPAGDEHALPAGHIRRVLATLSNKWVWIPGLSALLLALFGAMTLALLQSAQEKEQLQAALQATQKKLEQTAAKPAAANRSAFRPAGKPAVAAAAGSRPGVDAGDCLVTNKESVIQNLRHCIDSFNGDPPAPAKAAGV